MTHGLQATVKLTWLQRRILLSLLENEEEASKLPPDNPFREKMKAAIVEDVAMDVYLKTMQEKGVETDDISRWMGTMLTLGQKDIVALNRRFRAVVEKVRRNMKMLVARGLLIPETYALKRRRCTVYRLSSVGRLLAKRIRFDEKGRVKADKKCGELLDQAVESTRKKRADAGKPPYAKPEEILEELWLKSQELFENEREIFDEYWNKKKLGVEMKKKGYRLIRKRLNEGRGWIYDLSTKGYGRKEQIADLKAALATIRKKGIWRATVQDIKEALRKVCGAKFESREAFDRMWNRKRIGELMRELGFKLRQKRNQMLIEVGEQTMQAYHFDWYYDIRTVLEDGDVLSHDVQDTPLSVGNS